MSRDPANPLIVQGDRTILVEVDNPRYADARDALTRFAELEKSPEHVHTYRITPLSLWNAAAAGLSAAEAVDVLERFGKYPLPDNVRTDMLEYVSRYGRVKPCATAAGSCWFLTTEPSWRRSCTIRVSHRWSSDTARTAR